MSFWEENPLVVSMILIIVGLFCIYYGVRKFIEAIREIKEIKAEAKKEAKEAEAKTEAMLDYLREHMDNDEGGEGG